jgi:hypothetical protein
MDALTAWLAMDRREAPAQDRIVAALAHVPGLNRYQLGIELGMSYVRVAQLVKNLEDRQVVRAEYQSGVGTGGRRLDWTGRGLDGGRFVRFVSCLPFSYSRNTEASTKMFRDISGSGGRIFCPPLQRILSAWRGFGHRLALFF